MMLLRLLKLARLVKLQHYAHALELQLASLGPAATLSSPTPAPPLSASQHLSLFLLFVSLLFTTLRALGAGRRCCG